MNGNFKIGRIAGIDVNVHWSWLFIFVLVTWTFAQGVLKDLFPHWTGAQLWISGAIISAVFFTSILLHELSHSLVAHRYGLPVSSITLFVFGGVSNLTREPETPSQEFWIAIVGPLTSLAIAAVLGIAYVALHPVEAGVAGVLGNLAAINLAIAIFNMVPGFPMDGGRVLRSAFWARDHNVLDATRAASRIGVGIAYLMMALGCVSFIFVDVITGIWLFFIGSFLRTSSVASYEGLLAETVLKGVPATSIASQDYSGVSPEETIESLIHDHMLKGRGRCFPVLAGEELLGLICLEDINRVPRDDWATTTVYRAMTPFSQLATVSTRDDLDKASHTLALQRVNQVPVVDGKLLRGMIQRADIIHYIQLRERLGTAASATP